MCIRDRTIKDPETLKKITIIHLGVENTFAVPKTQDTLNNLLPTYELRPISSGSNVHYIGDGCGEERMRYYISDSYGLYGR